MTEFFSSLTTIDDVVSVEAGGKVYRFLASKNQALEEKYGFNFLLMISKLAVNDLVDTIAANQERHPGYQIRVIDHNYYLYEMPFLEQANVIWLTTFYPSRKMMLKYWGVKRKSKSFKKRLKKKATVDISVVTKEVAISIKLKD